MGRNSATRLSVIAVAALGLASCNWISGDGRWVELERGLIAAIDRGKSPFTWAEAFSGSWTQACFFGAYDSGDDLDLPINQETNWALVVFDGDNHRPSQE